MKIITPILVSLLLIACKAEKEIIPDPQEEQAQPASGIQGDIETPDTLQGLQKINQRPSVIAINPIPSFPTIGDTLHVTVQARDEDGDEIRFLYQWFRNDELIFENSDKLLLSSDFKKGDAITIYVTPNDGKEDGDPAFVKVTIVNSPPLITSTPQNITIKNNLLIYQVTAQDKEGDPLTYNLISGPEGTTIDKKGLLKWPIPQGFRGIANFQISVSDSDGAQALQSFSVEIGY